MTRGDSKTGIVFTAVSLLRVATKAHGLLDDGRPINEPRDVEESLTALLFAAAAFEAFVNELDELAAGTGGTRGVEDPRIKSLAEVLGEAEESKASTRLKYLLAGVALQGTPFDRGAQPWQDLELLIRIRDSIVHLRPIRFQMGDKGFSTTGDKLIQQLRERRLLPTLPDAHVMFYLQWLAPRSVARWAVNTAVRAVMTIVAALPEGEFKQAVLPQYSKDFVEIAGPSSNDAEWIYEAPHDA
jgi:hypothetical protein